MSEWTLEPRLLWTGYRYTSRSGVYRSPVATEAPRQARQYTTRPRTFSVTFLIHSADLALLESVVDAAMQEWRTYELFSAECGGPRLVPHTVRFSGPLQIRPVGGDLLEVATTLEQAESDETCGIVNNAAYYTACLGQGYTDTLGLDWDAMAARWGVAPDDWERLNHAPLVAGAGAYAVTGADARIEQYLLWAEAGAVALTGADAELARALLLTAEAGSYALTGADAELTPGP